VRVDNVFQKSGKKFEIIVVSSQNNLSRFWCPYWPFGYFKGQRNVTKPKIVTSQIKQSRNRKSENDFPTRGPRCTTTARHLGVSERRCNSKGVKIAIAAQHFGKYVE